MISRRALLRASTGLAATVGLGLAEGTAHAAVPPPSLKFIFVVNYGGWDPTRVFAPELANPNVDMEVGAVERQVGDLRYVDHPDRPNVRAFFERYAARSVLFNGVNIGSIAHESCLRIALTGATGLDRPDWGAILGASRSADFPIPQVVVGGPSFPGVYGPFVTRTGTSRQLAALLDGEIAAWSDLPVERTPKGADALMDATLARRVADAVARARPGQEALLTESLRVALERAGYLKGLVGTVAWDTARFPGQAKLAVDLLALQVSRVATLSYANVPWDSHADNDRHQQSAFEGLFTELAALLALLEAQPGEVGESLADETVVVVLSEMGRTPLLNAEGGKDHWPTTSALLVGPGIAGGRVIGGFDSSFYGRTVDLTTGEPADDASGLDASVLGATLLQLGGVDPAEHLPGVAVVTAALRA